MQIVNNKIYINRGETPTYDVSVFDKNTGIPYMLIKGVNDENPFLEFVVRPSVYSTKDDYIFKTYIDMSSVHVFDSEDIAEYEESVWDDSVVPLDEDINKLHRRTIEGVPDFAYYYNNQWIPYEFRITFTFPYEATSKMEPKTYLYEEVLFNGRLKENPQHDEIPIFVNKKDFIMEHKDFIVGGSLSE